MTEAPLLKRVSHVCLATPDLDRILAFYCGLLGCRIIHSFQRPGTEVYGVFVLVGEGTFLEIFKGPEPPGLPGCIRHFCFQVEDIQRVARRLEAAGIPAQVKEGRTDHVLLLEIDDPDGRRLEFHQIVPGSMQHPHLPPSEIQQ